MPEPDSQPRRRETFTRDEVRQLIREARMTPMDLANTYEIYQESQRRKREQEEEQEKIVMGAIGAWLHRHWKLASGIIGGAIALGAAGWKGWTWVEARAEEQVIERQGAQRQAAAVEANTDAVNGLQESQKAVEDRVADVEKKLQADHELNQLILRLQLQDPRAKRAVDKDPELKKEIEVFVKESDQPVPRAR